MFAAKPWRGRWTEAEGTERTAPVSGEHLVFNQFQDFFFFPTITFLTDSLPPFISVTSICPCDHLQTFSEETQPRDAFVCHHQAIADSSGPMQWQKAN